MQGVPPCTPRRYKEQIAPASAGGGPSIRPHREGGFFTFSPKTLDIVYTLRYNVRVKKIRPLQKSERNVKFHEIYR